MTKPFDITAPLSDETAQKIDENFNDVYTILAEGGGVEVINGETVGIQKGQAVRLIGGDGLNPVVARAKADADSTMPAVGLAAQDIAPKEKGTIIAAFQTLDKLDTSRFVLNDRLYVSDSSAGALTATKPTARAQDVGTVIAVNPTQGKILVAMGGLLSEPHKLLSITHDDTTAATVVRGDLLSGQAATPLWKRLALGSTGTFPRSDGTDIVYSTATIPDTFNAGDTIVATSSNVLGVVAPVAVGKALISQGTSSPPVWAQINLSGASSHVTLVLAVGNGGTGLNTSTSNAIIVGAGSSSYNKVAPPAAASLLRFTGSAVEWTADAQLTSSAFELVSGVSSMELRIREPSGGGSSYTGFKAPALAGNVVYTLPTADGSSGDVLGTNGSAVLSWSTPTVGDLLADGSVALTADWDAGSFEIRAQTFESDVTTGTAPLVIASTTVVSNLNADLLDGVSEAAFAFLAGRSGGQTLKGGTGTGDNLTLQCTAGDAVDGVSIIFLGGDNGDREWARFKDRTEAGGTIRFGLNVADPSFLFHAESANVGVTVGDSQFTLDSSDSFAIDKGGLLSFGGPFNTAGARTQFAGMAGRKENTTDGNTDGYFQVRTRGASAHAERMRIDSIGNMALGTTALPSTGTLGLVFGDGTALSSMGTNTAGLYANDVSATVEMFAIDEAGNAAQLTPHNFTLFEPDGIDPFPWSYYCKNAYLGIEINVDITKLARLVEQLTQEKIIHTRLLPQPEKLSWIDTQRGNVRKLRSSYERWEHERDNFTPRLNVPTFTELAPPLPVMKRPPRWLLSRLRDWNEEEFASEQNQLHQWKMEDPRRKSNDSRTSSSHSR